MYIGSANVDKTKSGCMRGICLGVFLRYQRSKMQCLWFDFQTKRRSFKSDMQLFVLRGLLSVSCGFPIKKENNRNNCALIFLAFRR